MILLKNKEMVQDGTEVLQFALHGIDWKGGEVGVWWAK